MNTIDLTVSRTIRTSPEAVFDRWLDTTRPGGLWYGPARVILNPVVDGLFYFLVHHEGREWAHYGRFIRIERGRLLEFTWMSEATRGVETIVTVTFEPADGGTHVTLHQAHLLDDEMGRGHQDGWASYLKVLAEQIEGASSE